MSGMNLVQVYAVNPLTTNSSTDLIYVETAGIDGAIHYSDFAAQFPGKTGSGASGTWGINISGNAATATSATSASSVALSGITGLGTGIATALAINTGSAGAPVLFNGAGGTPSSMVGTNITGTAAGLTAGSASAVAVGGITGLGTGVATALAINVGSSGAFVTFNGAGGTPSSMTGTNITGTAAGLTAGAASAIAVGGITGLGTGVATALAINVGTAGAFVTNGGALGTPSSGTLTNATGLPSGAGIACSTTNNNASAGQLGEIISSVIAFASAISLTSNTPKDITSITLTAGDWDVWGNLFLTSSANTMQLAYLWISSTSATVPDLSLVAGYSATAITSQYAARVPTLRFSLSGSTIIYISADIVYTGGSGSGSGGIYARRRR